MPPNLKGLFDSGHANNSSISEGSGPSNTPNLGQSSGPLFGTAQSSEQNYQKPSVEQEIRDTSIGEGDGPMNEPNPVPSSNPLFLTAQSSETNYQKPPVEQEIGDSSTSKGKGPSNTPKFEQSLGPLFGTAQSSKANYQKPSEESGDYYTTEQKKVDREGGCTEEQISAIENVLKCDLKEWYDILGVSDTCTTEEAHQAYKEKSLAVHPDRNRSTEATKAFQSNYFYLLP